MTLIRLSAMALIMRPSDYAFAVDGSQAAFAKRAGVAQTTFNAVCRGKGCNAKTALKIIRASHARPAPGGGVISLEDIALLDEQAA